VVGMLQYGQQAGHFFSRHLGLGLLRG
jgi:hypothetical protein